ncbi:uncharacterized protein L203_100552 [Cryptococcus depauperatus CBS 7841]|uniref:Uncharacterized protein n=1 Tax=Cryptococcus depauperatus CBS 7841 TaxID=1295531 RepID=A0A1E3HUC5_9TREE|nr:hypothetical protein L203_06058 [Cryptococcus depauperatus CBS 7841]
MTQDTCPDNTLSKNEDCQPHCESILPLDVLCNIVALIPPPFYTVLSNSAPGDIPPTYLIENIDPTPPLEQTPNQCISAISRSSSRLLEAARPWLWENVDVRSGRGWLSIVNALTEEVIEENLENTASAIGYAPDANDLESCGAMPISGQETLIQSTASQDCLMDGSSSTATFAYSPELAEPGISNLQCSTSPPQPSHIHQLLTPPSSRNSSPQPQISAEPAHILTSVARLNESPSPAPSLGLGPSSAVSPALTRTKLRGRSRSPRRSVNFDTEGIHAVLERSRSVSVHGSGVSGDVGSSIQKPFLHRGSSLSRSRTWHDSPTHEEGDEEDDEVMPLSISPFQFKQNVITPRIMPEDGENASSELLPPPGPYIRHLSFTNFRTIGSRRSQEEAVRWRFVTAGRLEGVIKNAPNLVSLCMTEYVDSSLSYPVIEEIFFRGYRRPRYRSPSTLSRTRSLSIGQSPSVISTTHDQLDPPRPSYVPYEDETEEQKWKRRQVFSPMEALDLTGCVSHAFTEGMNRFYNTWLATDDDTEDEHEERGRERWKGRRGRGRSPDVTEDESDAYGHSSVSRDRHYRRPPRFRAMRRLCLRMCTSLDSHIIDSLIWSFPCLTHLDLSNTRVSDQLLLYLTDHCPRSLRLSSLSLARCPRLSSYVIVDFLCRSPAVENLIDLSLFVNPTQGNAIESNSLMKLITEAHCIRSGKLRYLDLSSAKFTPAHLAANVFPPQPSLISLGLSHIPTLGLQPIANFLLTSAPNVEILTLVGTATTSSLDPTQSPLQITLELHTRLINPLTTIPFSFANLNLSSNPNGNAGGGNPINLNPGPTRLRVIELMRTIRRSIAPDGNGEWKIIKSKGGRGWYVDSSAGWRRVPPPQDLVKEGGDWFLRWEFVRHLPKSHHHRAWLNSLSEASGRVGSNVGWHSRKMEVIRGMGMMGREEGLAGVGAFAFEE